MTREAIDRADVELCTADGVRLAATTWRREGVTPIATVVVVHGLSMCRTDAAVAGTATALLDAGFAVITFDSRGHGDSGGVCTLGTDEAIDVGAAVVLARQSTSTVVAVGSSMGGIAVLRYSSAATNLAGIVIVSAPATWRIHSRRSLLAAIVTRTPPGRRILRRRTGVRLARAWDRPVPPVELAARTTCATAVIHGARDRFIPAHEAARLHGRLAGPRRLEIVADMAHGFGRAAEAAIVDSVRWVLVNSATTPTAKRGPPDRDRCEPSSPG